MVFGVVKLNFSAVSLILPQSMLRGVTALLQFCYMGEFAAATAGATGRILQLFYNGHTVP